MDYFPARYIQRFSLCEGYRAHYTTAQTWYAAQGAYYAGARLLSKARKSSQNRYFTYQGYAFNSEIFNLIDIAPMQIFLVRPSHVDTFVHILLADGWSIQAHFDTRIRF